MGPREKEFLEQMGIPASLVFDARGLGRTQYRSRMKVSGHWLASNTSACAAAGHRLRTRSGHCVICKPETLLFQIRYEATLDIYVVQSASSGLVKVGISDDAELRCRAINEEQYGGVADWELWWSCRCENAGRVEWAALSILQEHQYPLHWDKDGVPSVACEVFDVEPEIAVEAVRMAITMARG